MKEVALFASTFAISYIVAPQLSRWSRLPLITVHLTVGLFAQLTLGARMPKLLLPAHEAALACITFAAGSELVVSQLRVNAKAICFVAFLLTLASLSLVGMTALSLLNNPGGVASIPGLSRSGFEVKAVAAMLVAVVSIGRSPSSAIAVVSELRADGPFTQMVLSVTMVTDVIVIVLFTASAELAQAILADHSSVTVVTLILRFTGHVLLQLGLSFAHAACLTALCLLLLRFPFPALRAAALLLVGGYAFGAESLLETFNARHPNGGALRIEPMLACITAGFVVCNVCGARAKVCSGRSAPTHPTPSAPPHQTPSAPPQTSRLDVSPPHLGGGACAPAPLLPTS